MNDDPEKTRTLIALIVIASFLAMLGGLLVYGEHVTKDQALFGFFTGMAGVLAGEFKTAVGYFFMSSTGSKSKDKALIAAAGKPMEPEKKEGGT